MSNEIVKFDDHGQFTQEQISLIKDMFFKGCSADEFKVFIHACQRSRLDPLMRQIYPVKRWDANLKREAMTVQTGIDGYRLIAERTNRYMAGAEPTYKYGSNGELLSATAYVRKLGPDKQWHDISATAFYEEYCQKTKEGRPTAMWAKMPHNQLAKCAESLALRKAFPADMSGIYTSDEMAQGSVIDATPVSIERVTEEVDSISRSQLKELLELIAACPLDYQQKVMKHADKKYGGLANLPASSYDNTLDAIIANSTRQEAVEEAAEIAQSE